MRLVPDGCVSQWKNERTVIAVSFALRLCQLMRACDNSRQLMRSTASSVGVGLGVFLPNDTHQHARRRIAAEGGRASWDRANFAEGEIFVDDVTGKPGGLGE